MFRAVTKLPEGGKHLVAITYFKRFRMEIDLAKIDTRPVILPAGYRFVPWDPVLVDTHAEAKYLSFRTEIDANVFPCLAARDGCRRLMSEISHRDGFLCEATWLLVLNLPGRQKMEYCGTVQGIRDGSDFGAIQNLGVTPRHRGQGLGTCLLRQSLLGFRRAGLRRAYLEVTAHNLAAIRLYERFGFRKVRTVYKAAEMSVS